MATPATSQEFLDLVRKSGVADERRLDSYLKKNANPLPRDPQTVAQWLIRDGLITHFQAEQILLGKWKRFSIGKYKVLERLGSGGMGSVFLCEHKLMRRRVAVKVLPSAKAKDQAALDRFYREARAVAALDHPNIVHAYDIDQDENLHFLVMEYVDGSSLQEIVKKAGPLDVVRACHYIRQSALGLQHAHERQLLHRDIKPGNILVDRTGQVKILDMGLARFFNDEEDIITRKYDENVLGTADYLAPEQAVDSHLVDIRADVYSLGATFYFLLTGKTPFGEGTVAQKLLWHQTKQPRPIPEFDARVPWPLWQIIEKMMAKDPAQRYQTPAEVGQALVPFTQTPIPPPSDQEMPHLSPAATGIVNPTGDPETVISGGSGTSRPTTPLPVGRPSSPTTPQPAAPAVSRPATPRPSAPPMPTPQVPSRPQPGFLPNSPAVAMEDPAQWSSLTDTDDPSAKADTNRSGKIPPLHSSPLRDPKKLWAILGVGAVFLVLVGFFVVRAVLTSPQTNKNPSNTVRPKLEIGKTLTGPNAYLRIADALRYAKPGDVLELQDEIHQENLEIDPSRKIPSEITLQAAPGKEVLWTSARKDEETPLLRLFHARGFRILGKGITLDGTLEAKKRLKSLIVISGHSPGLFISDATFQNLGPTGIKILNAAGDEDQPIRLSNLKFKAGKSDPILQGAIFLDLTKGLIPALNESISITEDCQFEGIPADKTVKLAQPAVVGKHVHLPHGK